LTQDGEKSRLIAEHEAVIAAGRDAGLTECGVASCAASEHGERLDAWLARGAHGSMSWMERTAQIRKDLKRKWTWARSALVGALSYRTAPPDRSELTGIARYVSCYARSRDYHDVLRERLQRWGDGLERSLGRSFRRIALVDTSAILERELAMRAGLGWFGKNTCLIGPRGDSWRFLGVLLTDLELAAGNERAAERCGSCTACLDACPTKAFPEPWVLDARRCISYLTIEHRGPIPPELSRDLGDWLFGCDVCQEVCPWNRRAEIVNEPDFTVSSALSETTLAGLLRMSEGDFRERFRRTPLSRAKRAGLVRNAILVALATDDREAIEIARSLAEDPDEGVREAARLAENGGQA
jgi:epoxyqueuosine reductase